MARPELELEFESRYGFDETVERLIAAAPENKLTVLGVHPISKTLEEKGFPREPLTVLEICNASLAAKALAADLRIALMMPCPVAVFERAGRVCVAMFNAPVMTTMYEGEGLAEVAEAMHQAMSRVVASVEAP